MTFKVALQYLFIFLLFKTVSYFKLKIDPKMYTFKNLEQIRKPGKIFEKASGNPV